MQDIAQAVGQAIRVTRQARGLSLERLAELAGLSLTYVGEIERGKKDASLRTLVKIARALKIPLGVLVAPLEAEEEGVSKQELLQLLDPLLKARYQPQEVAAIIACVRDGGSRPTT